MQINVPFGIIKCYCIMLYCIVQYIAWQLGVKDNFKEKRMRSRLERLGRERAAGKEWSAGRGRGVSLTVRRESSA